MEELGKYKLALRLAAIEIRNSYEGAEICPMGECGKHCDDRKGCIESIERRLLKTAKEART